MQSAFRLGNGLEKTVNLDAANPLSHQVGTFTLSADWGLASEAMRDCIAEATNVSRQRHAAPT